MKGAGPLTPAELAERTGLREPYVHEWLAAEAASGYVDHDAQAGTFTLSPEQALAFADEDSPTYLVGGYHLVGSLYADRPRITDALRLGPRLRLARARPGALPRHRAVLPSRLPRQPRRRLAPRPGRCRRAAHRGREGRRRGVRPRRLHRPDGPGVPGLTVPRLRLPPGLHRRAPTQLAAQEGVGDRHRLRDRLGEGLPGRGLRPGLLLRLPPRHGRPGRRAAPHPRAAGARRDGDAGRAAGPRRAGRQPQPGRPRLLRRLHRDLHALLAGAGRRGRARGPGRRASGSGGRRGGRLHAASAGPPRRRSTWCSSCVPDRVESAVPARLRRRRAARRGPWPGSPPRSRPACRG